MTGNGYSSGSGAGLLHRKMIRVCAPTAHSGIGDALRRAFAPPPANGVETEFIRMLEKV